MRLRITHRTTYSYDAPVTYGLQQLRLTPKSRDGQSVLTWNIAVEGGTQQLTFEDQHANNVTLIGFDGESDSIVITSSGEVETSDRSGVVGRHAGYAPLWYFRCATALTQGGNGVRGLAKGLNAEVPDPIARMHALSARIAEAVTYTTGRTDARTTAEQAIAGREGVCQDHAHIFISAARMMGFPARYVSGYLKLDADLETSQDAAHGWAEAHIDGIGWIGFDVSNQISPDERYVRVATGLDYTEAAPIHGMRYGDTAGESLSVDIEVHQDQYQQQSQGSGGQVQEQQQ